MNKEPNSILEVALIGNQNSGKTTFFNLLTGARQQTGNWPGVTVERKEGFFTHKDQKVHVVDLPGTYSLDYSGTSADEQIARNYVLGNCYDNKGNNTETLFLNIIDATTLERGLYLTMQLRELGVPVIVFLNMIDIAEKRNMRIDHEMLSERLGCSVIPLSLKRKQSVKQLFDVLVEKGTELINTKSSIEALPLNYNEHVETALASIQKLEDCDRVKAIKLLQDVSDTEVQTYRQSIERDSGEDLDFLLAEARFEKATVLAQEVIKERGKVSRTRSDKIDNFVLGNWTGIPIFLALMYLLFSFSINIGGAFIDFFDLSAQAFFVDGFGHLLNSANSPQWLTTLLADGIGGGVQVVATFIPIIGALFLFLTVLEESGYMARAAFVMDHFMRKLGISGKAFVPLIVGFGCNVPGIMATRTLDNARERIITVLMSPFMSCGARLAVYALFAAAFFPVGGQNIVFLLYLIGILFAIMTGLILRKTLLKGEAEDFFMEMPTYQIPSIRNVLLNTWNKLRGFILGAGKIIVLVVMLINVANSLGTDFSFGNENTEKSVLSASAKTVTPIFKPMGIEEDNWPATVGIITGLLAKEVVVGTLDALYSKIDKPIGEEEDVSYSLSRGLKEALETIPVNLGDALNNLSDPLGLSSVTDLEDQQQAAEAQEIDVSTFGAMHKRFDGKVGAFAYLLFILLYFPCAAATGAMYKETGAKWTILGVTWSTGLAYASAVIFYQVATFSSHPMQSAVWTLILLSILILTILVFARVGKKQAYPSSTRTQLPVKII